MYSLSAGERVVGAARVGLAVGERDNSFRTHRWQKAPSHFGLTSALPILPLYGGGRCICASSQSRIPYRTLTLVHLQSGNTHATPPDQSHSRFPHTGERRGAQGSQRDKTSLAQRPLQF